MGASIKDARTKSQKNWPPPPCPCECGHTLHFEKSGVFCTKKCGRPHLKNSPCQKNVRTGETPHSSPLTADVLYGQPLGYIVFTTAGWFYIEIVKLCRIFEYLQLLLLLIRYWQVQWNLGILLGKLELSLKMVVDSFDANLTLNGEGTTTLN